MTGAIDYRHVSILWASPEHAPELAQLHAGLFAKAWDAAGFIVSQLAADEAEILTLGVRKDSQRHGIARRLVEATARAAKKAEVRRLFLEVGRGNVAALGLYTGLGFKEVGRRKGYYEHPGAAPEDALVLALGL